MNLRAGGDMRNVTLVLSVSVVLMLSSTAFGDPRTGTSFPAQYEGGSLGLKQNRSVKAVVAGNEVVLVQHGRRVSVPVQNISEIACATEVHRRFGAAVLGLVPRMDLDKARAHYVGVTWTDDTGPGASLKTAEVVFKLNASEYRNFVATLE